MKFKYKKLIIFVALGTMFLSFIILSMVPNGGTGETPPEEAEVKKDANKDINTLVNNYFHAKLNVDMDAMEDLVSDIKQIDKNKLVAQQEYVEDYQNISCYVIANENKDAFRVYVYYDMKIKNINTLAPSLSGLYIRLGSDGDYRVYLSALDEDEEEFIQSADKNDTVVNLKKDTAEKLKAAIASDENFRQFYQKIDKENAAAKTVTPSAKPNGAAPAAKAPAAQAPAAKAVATPAPATPAPATPAPKK